jgi:predicted TPR repeat methyltransferase
MRLESGDREAARELYDRALTLDPVLVYALHQRALLAELDGDPEQAAGLYLRVLGAAHPAHPIALRARLRLQALGALADGLVTE